MRFHLLPLLVQHQQVQKALEGSKKYEIPRKWILLEEGFTAERGMMTPKMSIKRHIVMKVHACMHLCTHAPMHLSEPSLLQAAFRQQAIWQQFGGYARSHFCCEGPHTVIKFQILDAIVTCDSTHTLMHA